MKNEKLEKIEVEGIQYTIKKMKPKKIIKFTTDFAQREISEIEMFEILLSSIVEPKGINLNDFTSIALVEELTMEILKIQYKVVPLLNKLLKTI